MNDEEKLKSVVFFIEASSFERMGIHLGVEKNNIYIKHDHIGFSRIIGFIGDKKNDRPVNVDFSFAEIFGKRICFYHAISRFVDHTMVENYIKEKYPVKYDNGRWAMTNADNYGHAISACREMETA